MSKVDRELIDPTIEPSSEKLHRVIGATVASIPAFGPVAFECFNTLIQPPMEKRQEKWMLQVTEAINELYKKGIVTEKELQKNETFFTTLVNASNTALRTHEKEKLDSLKTLF
ncbi:hypothetical protein L1077_13595 [Pseudoalteromonas luteoviolacea]|uniref:hypothetical protein n=1 Tax=Pseudoalteromonas luteoviolacea TaxID=43657 RepID=UPI001F35BE25|nr:hypothetical protein [Pseudoalteromonas luteoviolacea]MCF6440465.1 hypothetical protein [Pseudoalteromonas luteoviolacea]